MQPYSRHAYDYKKSLGSSEEIYIESISSDIIIENISNFRDENDSLAQSYRIGNGDQISITVWGLPDIFQYQI